MVGKWEAEKGGKRKEIMEFFTEGACKSSMLGLESRYKWLDNGKHLRFEYGPQIAEIYDATLEGDVLTINKTRYKKVKE